MSKNDKNKGKPHVDFREEILDQFPEDMLPGHKPQDLDPLTSSFAEMVEVSGIRKVVDKMVKDPEQRQAMGVFLDALIEKQSPHFESMRESLKNDSVRRKILLEIAKATGKHVK